MDEYCCAICIRSANLGRHVCRGTFMIQCNLEPTLEILGIADHSRMISLCEHNRKVSAFRAYIITCKGQHAAHVYVGLIVLCVTHVLPVWYRCVTPNLDTQ